MIGTLTNDMTRLCGEMEALRDSRAQFRDDLQDTVSRKLAELRNSREDMADRTRTELRNFVGSVSDAVAAFREEFLGDLAGARRAWRGHNSAQTPSRMAAEEQSKEFAAKAKKKRR